MGKIQSPHTGTHVIHAANIKDLKSMARQLVKTDNADLKSLDYMEHEVKTKKAFISWLNTYFNTDNG